MSAPPVVGLGAGPAAAPVAAESAAASAEDAGLHEVVAYPPHFCFCSDQPKPLATQFSHVWKLRGPVASLFDDALDARKTSSAVKRKDPLGIIYSVAPVRKLNLSFQRQPIAIRGQGTMRKRQSATVGQCK